MACTLPRLQSPLKPLLHLSRVVQKRNVENHEHGDLLVLWWCRWDARMECQDLSSHASALSHSHRTRIHYFAIVYTALAEELYCCTPSCTFPSHRLPPMAAALSSKMAIASSVRAPATGRPAQKRAMAIVAKAAPSKGVDADLTPGQQCEWILRHCLGD